MKSMTGFGAGEAALPEGRVVAELRTVNSRHLEVRVRLPKELGDAGLSTEQQVRARLSRGRCDVAVRLELSGQAPLGLDLGRAQAALKALTRLRDLCAPGSEVPLTLLASVPDLFAPPEGEMAALREAVGAAVGAALDALAEARQREGEALRADLSGRIARVVGQVDALAERRTEAAAAARRRLAERVRALLSTEGLDGSVNAGRVEQEIVSFVERNDVTEELTRLKIHLGRMAELLGEPGSVGRELDFLLQEAGREINTTGSKAQDAAMAQLVVAAKAELERLREQVQNVE